uniref:Uncharacterized protein n=1 Tax=Glossina austeni TaxID=7395 RepID=A0A1A9V4W3_GLOAU
MTENQKISDFLIEFDVRISYQTEVGAKTDEDLLTILLLNLLREKFRAIKAAVDPVNEFPTLKTRLLDIGDKDEISGGRVLKEIHKNTVKTEAKISIKICQNHIFLLIIKIKTKDYKTIIAKFNKAKHIYQNADFIVLFDKKNLCLSSKYYDQLWCIDSRISVITNLCSLVRTTVSMEKLN